MDIKIKAELLAIGKVRIEESNLKLTVPTAGPGAGNRAIFFKSGNKRVRLGINQNSPLQLIKNGMYAIILKDGKEFVRGMIEEELIHCPNQAYITISEKCLFDCKFCPVPKLDGKIKSINQVIDFVDMAHASGKMDCISITTGIADSPEIEVERVLNVLHSLKKYSVPIGVSVYPTNNSSRLLKKAGAYEIKYNVETMDRNIFKLVCVDMNFDFILNCLSDAVNIFGKNRVFSNFIIGLGETDKTVKMGVKKLAEMGVIPILRPIASHPLRIDELNAIDGVNVERPNANRLIKLNDMLREILDDAGLSAGVAKTMCIPCKGCDLSPSEF
ncbi:MAG: radical SAM protein [Methanosarcinales archaeon]|nr:radical SAM protein [Methanosarcinales archaeon]